MNKLDEMEQRIVDVVTAIPARAKVEGWKSDLIWTREIKCALAIFAKDSNLYVCASGCEPFDQGEWLYDMVWLSTDGHYLKEVPLVLESEWSTKRESILEDFYKLLLACARHRVMIFQQERRSRVDQVMDELETQIRHFGGTQPGDRYLFLGLDWYDTGEFTHRLFIV